MKRLLFIVCSLIVINGIFSQNQDTAELRPIREVIFTTSQIKAKIDSYKNDMPLKTVKSDLGSKKFIAQTKPENYWGFQRVYKQGNEPEMTVDFILQDYKNTANQKQNAAIGKVTLMQGKEMTSYTFFLVADNTNYKEMKEYYVDSKNKIVLAHSWWSCVKRVAQRRCGRVVDACESIVSQKYGTIVAYVGCYGGCALGTMACCACDCTWWCSLIGCCHR